MWFWWLMFVCNLMIPITMVVIGRMLWKNAPKQISSSFGYRTARSMQNKDTWTFANEYCGRLWWKWGWMMAVPTILAQMICYRSNIQTIGILSVVIVSVQLVAVLLTIIPTEKALKKKFHEDGTQR